MATPAEASLKAENLELRELLGKAGLDASKLLEQAGITATERDAADRLQRLLLEELHHRVKNTLANVQAIASQSLRYATSIQEGREAISNRLIALGHAHDLLLQTNWQRARLSAVVAAAIKPFDTRNSSQFSIQDSDIEVGPPAVLSLALALNELSTNAVKYGALSTPRGRVEISMRVDEEARRFRLTWQEKDGPPVQKPTRRSFGTRLIESSIAKLLDGDAGLHFEPSGVVCDLDFPLAALQAVSLDGLEAG